MDSALGTLSGTPKPVGMQFLAITRRRTESFSDAQFAEALGIEADRARALYADGIFRTLNSRGDIPGAVIGIEAPDFAAAQAAIASLPFAQREMMDVEIIPLRPYRGFVP